MRMVFDVLQQGCVWRQFINASSAIAVLLPSPTWSLCYTTLQFQGTAEPRPGELQRSETPPYSHQSHDDGCDTLGSRPTPAFYFIVQFLHAKCVSLLRLCRKTHELASAQAVRCLAAVNHLLRLDFCFNA